jgi:hypothetical protein
LFSETVSTSYRFNPWHMCWIDFDFFF